MNTKQRWVLGIGVILLVLMVIIPPWKGTRVGEWYEQARPVLLDYHPIFDPPSVPDAAIDGTRLFIQIFALSAVSGVLFILLKDREKA